MGRLAMGEEISCGRNRKSITGEVNFVGDPAEQDRLMEANFVEDPASRTGKVV